MSLRCLALDANILIRAVLGNKVRDLIVKHAETVNFFVPDVCVLDAEKYLPLIFEKRNLSVEPALSLLSKLQCLFKIVDKTIYEKHAKEAYERIKSRDINDWPIVATALALNSAIWTEDQDFFGSGIPTWTTDRVHIFFETKKESLFQMMSQKELEIV
ncbi:MAG: PIN domain-containing protein [Legionella sp.]|nr:PIN domain-containing protein [Legionella sp.]